MKKQLNATSITNELRNGSHFFSPQANDDGEYEQPETKIPHKNDNEISVRPEPRERSMENPVSQPTNESTTQSTDQSTRGSTQQSTDQSTEESTTRSTTQSTTNSYDESPILGRPKSFYISHQQDKDLDLAVAKLASGEFGPQIQKIDRSSLLRLILEETDVTSEKSLRRLHQRYIDRQLYQLNSRQPSRQPSRQQS